jgi:hypothetical protein
MARLISRQLELMPIAMASMMRTHPTAILKPFETRGDSSLMQVRLNARHERLQTHSNASEALETPW